jgi:hypothetical protein
VLPPWSSWFGEDAMRELVPDDHLRTTLEKEMPRLPLSYLDASMPIPDGWDARPCAYLLLTGESYAESAAAARRRGWPVAELSGVQHLAIATEPLAVTDAILELEGRWWNRREARRFWSSRIGGAAPRATGVSLRMESGTPSRGTGRAMSEIVELTQLEGNPPGLAEAVVAAGYILSVLFDRHA